MRADALGDLPLALEQAVVYASTQAIMLSASCGSPARPGAAAVEGAGRPGMSTPVATVWQLAFEQSPKHSIANSC